MHLVYFSHSYRQEDALVVRYFGELIRSEGLLPVLDPPSESVNAARLQHHLRDSDGMIVLLTRRDDGVSPHVLFEATLCLQARKPLLVFVEDVLSVDIIPQRILRSRFSRKWFFRQVRDHRQSVRLFQSYLGNEPPPRYQPVATKQTCLAIGTAVLAPKPRKAMLEAIEQNGYNVIAEPLSDWQQDQSIQISEHLACADLAVEVVDSSGPADQFLMGAVRAAFIPRISVTIQQDFPCDTKIPQEYQPRIIQPTDPQATRFILDAQFSLYEQAFVELDTVEEVTRYVNLLLSTGNPLGEYERGTRNLFVKELTMGDQYKVGQAGAVGPKAHAHDMTFQQIWNESADRINLDALASDLARLRAALREEARTAEEDAAIGEVALAETAAKQKDGPKALAHLKKAGQWALGVAEKIGVAVATGAIKTALGM
jgi:hypothetical protein